MVAGPPGQAVGTELRPRVQRQAVFTGEHCLAGCAGKQVAVGHTGWATALGQAPERGPGGGSVSPALARTAAAAAGGGGDSSPRGRQLADRWVGTGDTGRGQARRAGVGLVADIQCAENR